VTVVEPDGSVWRYRYDEQGNLTSLIDPAGAVTGYTYDEQGNLATAIDAAANVRRIETNAAGLPRDHRRPRRHHQVRARPVRPHHGVDRSGGQHPSVKINLPMCNECQEFYGRLAYHRQQTIVIEPGGSRTFYPDGSFDG
jgi:YD repeat-containing protein